MRLARGLANAHGSKQEDDEGKMGMAIVAGGLTEAQRQGHEDEGSRELKNANASESGRIN